MRLSRTAFVFAALSFASSALYAQARRVLDQGEPEAQLMGYYAAVMHFSPVGLPGQNGRLEIGGAASIIPRVSDQDRIVGFGGTKSENTNLCPVYPRITASKGFGRFAVEAGFTPPVSVCGAKADVIALALGRRMKLGETWDGYARLSGMSGTVDVSAACSKDAVANVLDQTCYGGTPSADRIATLTIAFEYAAAWQGWKARHIEPYVSFGIRHERVDFDVNYSRDSAQALAVHLPALFDNNRLQVTLTRVHIAAGAAWDPFSHVRLGAELYYAPGALMTLRGRMAIAL